MDKHYWHHLLAAAILIAMSSVAIGALPVSAAAPHLPLQPVFSRTVTGNSVFDTSGDVIGRFQRRISTAGGGPGPDHARFALTLRVVNVDGPTARVVPWPGARPFFVKCGRSRVFATRKAPRPPWRLTVRNASNGKILLRRKIALGQEGMIIAVHATRATIGPSSGVSGGRPIHGHTCP